jgi:hypothetical protein
MLMFGKYQNIMIFFGEGPNQSGMFEKQIKINRALGCTHN